MPPQAQVTSALLWRCILIVAPVVVVFVSFLSSWVRFASPRKVQWLIAGTTAGFFAALWAVVVSFVFWQPVYHYLFPEWSRWLLPLLVALGRKNWLHIGSPQAGPKVAVILSVGKLPKFEISCARLSRRGSSRAR